MSKLPSSNDVSSTAVGIIFNQQRKQVLCVRRRDMPLWVLPGGAIDAGETPDQAVLREVEEETGLVVSIRRKAAEYAVSCWLTRPTHLYEVEVESGEPVLTDETSHVGYFPVDELPEPFFETHRDWICDVLAHADQLIERPQTEITWPKAIIWALTHPLMTLRFYLAKQGWVYPVADAPGIKKRR